MKIKIATLLLASAASGCGGVHPDPGQTCSEACELECPDGNLGCYSDCLRECSPELGGAA